MAVPDTEPMPAEPVEPEPVQPDVPEPGDWPAGLRDILDALEKVQRARALFNGSTVGKSGRDYPVAQVLLEELENGLKGEFAAALVKLTMDRSDDWDPHPEMT
jgi:hypothetical protein